MKHDMKTCMVSVDVEEDISDTSHFHGVEGLGGTLALFENFGIEATLFVTGEVLEKYPDMVGGWSQRHEIGCHGYRHVPLYELSIPERDKQLRDFCVLYRRILGRDPEGFRAVMHTIDDPQLKLLETHGFIYDSSVIPRYIPFRKYVGYKGKAPTRPYHPSHDSYRQEGKMKILEIPNTPLLFGVSLYGTWLRFFGPGLYRWLLLAKKPGFVSLAAHSWDGLEHEGAFSRNSGDRFYPILERVLVILKNHGYRFSSGRALVSALGRVEA
jgi:hypothetical protein